MGTAAQPKRLFIYAVQRPRKSRSKNGCLQCKGRRKKCSEERPVCKACKTSTLQCTWPPGSANGASTQRSRDEAVAEKTLSPTSSPLNQTRPGSHGGNSVTTPEILQSNITGWDPEGGDFDETEFLSTTLTELRKLEEHLLQSCILPRYGSPTPQIEQDIISREGSDGHLLFDHFCQKTILWLLNCNDYNYIIEKHIIPLATTNSLVLHAVLALSGVHLRHVLPSIEAEALKYYTSALCELNQVLSDQLKTQEKDYRILLTTMFLLCHYEIVDGGTYGAALQHVRACREFVYVALEHIHDPEHQELAVLLIESYGYFSLIANLSGSVSDENIRLGLEFSTSIMPLIKDLPTFGAMFAYEPEFLCLTPLIARLSRYRKSRASLPMDQFYSALYDTLQNSLCWKSPLDCSTDVVVQMVADKELLIKDLKTQALLIFLQASFYRHDGNSADMATVLHPLIDDAMFLVTHIEATDADYGLCWPYIVIGSHLHDKQAQELILRRIDEIQSHMPMQKSIRELFQALWDDPSAFGLGGVEKITMLHGANSFIC